MKAYLIDAAARVIRPLDYEAYGEMQKYLPNGPSIAMTYPNGDVLYVDEEALLGRATMAFRIRARSDGQPMMSNGILTGPDDMRTTLPPRHTIPQLWNEIEWLDLPVALDWFRARATEPAVTTQFGRGPAQVHATWGDILLNLEGGKGYDPDTCPSLLAALREPP